jgi:hypothetical protein
VAPAVEAPVVPVGAARRFEEQAATLLLQRGDLPAGFQLAAQGADEASSAEAAAVYLRPVALDLQASGGNPLLGVISSVGVYTTTAQAEAVWAQGSAQSSAQMVAEITSLMAGATGIEAEPFAGSVRQADAAEAYRVTYRVAEMPIYEYRQRFRLGNVVASVVVSSLGETPAGAAPAAGLGSGGEPEQLLEAAQALTQKQIDRIVGSAGGAASPQD